MSDAQKYPWLSKHRVASPCKVEWSDMKGDDRKRYCGQCKLNVYNLSILNKAEAEELLSKNGGKICTYFYMRKDGTVLTQDCPVGFRQILKKRGIVAAVVYAASLLMGFSSTRAESNSRTLLMGRAPAPQGQMLGGAPVPIRGESTLGAIADPKPIIGDVYEPGEPPAQALIPDPDPNQDPNAIPSPCPMPIKGKPARTD